jgi:muramoyltetrapeptide carboxypeptidase
MSALHGRRIEVIAPSGAHLSIEEFDRAFQWFEACGAVLSCTVPREGWQRFSAPDQQRLDAIHWAAEREDLDAVMATRGGYGLSRLIDRIDWSLIAASVARGCRWVGYSDFTLIHLGLLAHSGSVSWAGPFFNADFGASAGPDAYTLAQFESLLSDAGPPAVVWSRDDGTPRLRCDGLLWGGNLSMICSVAGSRWCPDIDQGLLFIEDVGEHPYRIERMLHQLDALGILRRQSALILGDFTDWRLAPHDQGYDLGTMIDYWRDRVQVPIVTGLPFGHGRRKAVLGVGMTYRLEVEQTQVTLEPLGLV